jgi:hypothetical protein
MKVMTGGGVLKEHLSTTRNLETELAGKRGSKARTEDFFTQHLSSCLERYILRRVPAKLLAKRTRISTETGREKKTN